MAKEKREFGRLAVLECKELNAPKDAEPVSRYLVFDTGTKTPVYWVKEDEKDPVKKATEVLETQMKNRLESKASA